MAAVMGMEPGMEPRMEFREFHVNQENDNVRLRRLLQNIGAPANFWEDIALPIEATTLEQIPSQR